MKLIDDARSCGRWIKGNKDKRNRYAHWWWSRTSDNLMFCHKFTFKGQAADAGEIDNHDQVSNEETEAFANEISERGTQMLWLLKMLQQKLPALS